MSELRKYNTDAIFYFPLVGDGVQDFINDYTPAAGDAKLFSDTQISANLTAFILGFDSLSELPVPGDQIDENGAGTAEAVVIATVVVSGTVGGGDAAGFFFVRAVAGQAWSNNDQIDINGGTANIATADSTTYDLAATAGLIGDIGNGQYACALTPTEMSCAQGEIHIVDSATKAIEDQAIKFHTFGNAAALLAADFDDSVRLGLTALPNADADAAGGLVVSDLGGLDADAMATDSARLTAVRAAVLTDWIDAGRLDVLLDAITAAGPTNAEMEARTLVAASYFDPTADAVATVTTLTNKTGFSLSTAGILAIWHQLVAAVVTASTMGKLLKDNINATISSRNAATPLDAAGIRTAVGLASADLDTQLATLSTHDAAAVWAVATRVLTANTNLNDLDAAGIRTAVGLAAADLDTQLGTLSTHSAADIWSVATRVLTAGTNLEDLSASEVLTQVNAALDTAIAELGVGVPSATPSIRTALALLYMALRDEGDSTATLMQIKNNAGTVIAKATLSDDGTTFTRAKMVSG